LLRLFFNPEPLEIPMSISLEPNKGLRLKLDRFSPIRTWHGGGNLWAHEFQLTVRQGALATFLPKAVEEDDSVLFELRSGGTELVSTSTAIGSLSEIPAAQLEALRAAVTDLKNKAEDPHCDRTKRQIIQGFRLPDPQTDKDLYRLVGHGGDRKLIVLWGVEREEGSALDPMAAVDLMHTPSAPASPVFAERKSKLAPALVVVGIAAAALAAGGAYFGIFSKAKAPEEKSASSEGEAAKNAAPKIETGPLESAAVKTSAISEKAPSSATVASSTLKTSETPSPKGSVESSSSVKTSSTTEAGTLITGGSAKSVGAAVTTGTMTLSGNGTAVAGLGAGTLTSGGSLTGAAGTLNTEGSASLSGSGKSFPAAGTGSLSSTGSAIASGTSAQKSTGSGSALATGTVKGGSLGAAAPLAGGSQTFSGTSTSTGNSSAQSVGAAKGRDSAPAVGSSSGSLGTTSSAKGFNKGEGSAGGRPAAGGSLGTVSTGSNSSAGAQLSQGSMTSSGSSASAPFNEGGNDAKKTAMKQKNGVRKVESNSVSQTANTSVPQPTPPTPTPAPAPPMPEATVMTPNGPPPVGISSLTIVSTSLSKMLADGKVEVLLNIVARTDKGMVGDAPPINEWRVDGVIQLRPDGKVAEGPVLPVTLNPGKHTITTIGRGADGNPYRTDADVVIRPQE